MFQNNRENIQKLRLFPFSFDELYKCVNKRLVDLRKQTSVILINRTNKLNLP